jgi:hypothetical protein
MSSEQNAQTESEVNPNLEIPAQEAETQEQPSDATEGNEAQKPEELKTEKAPEEENSTIREMRRQLKRQSRELQELRQMQVQATAQPDPRPARENFADESSYVQAEVAYQLKQTQAQQQKQPDILESTRNSIRKTHPDFDEVLQDIEHIRFRQESVDVFSDAVETLEHGDELYYRLAKNPEIAEKLSLLSPGAFAARLGEMHADIVREKTKKPSITKAPSPITPEKSSIPVSKTYDDMSDEEFARTRRKERTAHKMRYV